MQQKKILIKTHNPLNTYFNNNIVPKNNNLISKRNYSTTSKSVNRQSYKQSLHEAQKKLNIGMLSYKLPLDMDFNFIRHLFNGFSQAEGWVYFMPN